MVRIPPKGACIYPKRSYKPLNTVLFCEKMRESGAEWVAVLKYSEVLLSLYAGAEAKETLASLGLTVRARNSEV